MENCDRGSITSQVTKDRAALADLQSPHKYYSIQYKENN